jgi:hypothetical protein
MDADLLLERDGRDSGIENVIHRQKSDTQSSEIEKLIKVLVTTLKLCAVTFGPFLHRFWKS